jgi:hypothetical protein
MGQDTESTYTNSPIKTNCNISSSGKSDCVNHDNAIVSGQKMDWLGMYYYSGKVYMVLGSAPSLSFGEFMAEFKLKYGNPDLITSEKWRSQAGASFDNNVVYWKFKDGTLKLSSIGLNIKSCLFEFNSAPNSPPSESPKVDF